LFATAVQSETISIPDLLRGLEAVICAVIGREGSLQDANRGFLLLMTRSACAPDNVQDLFVTPKFEEISARSADPFDATIYRGLLSFGTLGGKVTSLRGAIYSQAGNYILIAEHDLTRVETLRTTVLELQDELAVKQRQMMHLEHRIGQLQELAEAALRDRDALLDAIAEVPATAATRALPVNSR
jgi:hypothetical protein